MMRKGTSLAICKPSKEYCQNGQDGRAEEPLARLFSQAQQNHNHLQKNYHCQTETTRKGPLKMNHNKNGRWHELMI